MKSKKVNSMTFRQAVEATSDITKGFKAGLTAMGTHSRKISVTITQLIDGSVDIDSCTTQRYPNANRWDYAFSYKGEVYFIEVHSANTREVGTVLKKLKWLKEWLIQQAPEINKMKVKSQPAFYWIQSNNCNIPASTPQYRSAVSAGLKPIAKLTLE